MRLESELLHGTRTIETLRNEAVAMSKDRSSLLEQINTLKNMHDTDLARCKSFETEARANKQTLYKVEEQFALNQKLSNASTIELIALRKDLVMANNAVVGLRKQLISKNASSFPPRTACTDETPPSSLPSEWGPGGQQLLLLPQQDLRARPQRGLGQ